MVCSSLGYSGNGNAKHLVYVYKSNFICVCGEWNKHYSAVIFGTQPLIQKAHLPYFIVVNKLLNINMCVSYRFHSSA